MSDDRDHTIATATVTSEETPYGVRINTGGHALRGDEPVDRGGADSGPAPFGLLLSGLVTLHGVDEDQRAKLAEIAEKTPVTRAVRVGTEIRTTTGAA
jgi:putative redox protein